jgi:flagellar basal body-associated protein FliL
MNKKSTRLLAMLAFLFSIGAVGAMQYFNASKKGDVTEDAAEAVDAAATAALDWTKDRSERTVEVVTMLGQTPEIVTVRTVLTVQGASKLSEVCASLPRVRDSINLMLFDRVRATVVRGGQIDLASYEGPLKAALNRVYHTPTVDRVSLSLGNAAMGDSGCTERSARRGSGPNAPLESDH